MKRHNIAAIAGGAALVLVLVWYLALYAPEGNSLKAAKVAQAQAQAQVVAAQAQLALLISEQPKLKPEEKVLDQLIKAVPNGPSLDQLVQTVDQAATASGVTLTDLGTPEPTGWGTLPGMTAPASASLQAGPQFISLSADVGGTKGQVLNFIRALDHEPRIYVVTSFSVDSTVGQQATVAVEAFFVSGASTDPTFPGSSPGSP